MLVVQSFLERQQFKRDVLTEIAATLSFSALQNNDKVGLLLFSDQKLFIPPKKGRSHILRIIRELLEFEPQNKATDISAAWLGDTKKKAIVFCFQILWTMAMKDMRIAAKNTTHGNSCLWQTGGKTPQPRSSYGG